MQLTQSNELTKSVYVISEHLMFGYGLQHLLKQQSNDIQIVGQEDNFDRAIEQIVELQPDVIVLYSHTPLKTGAFLAKRLLVKSDNVYIVTMSVDNNKLYTYQITQKSVQNLDDLVDALYKMPLQ